MNSQLSTLNSDLIPVGYQRTEVGVIPEDWGVALVGSISESGSGTTPARAFPEKYYNNGTTSWVKTLDLNNWEINNTDERVTLIAVKETCLRVFPAGTVLVAMYGGFNQIGRTGILTIRAAINQAITAILPNKQLLDSRFLLLVLNYRVDYWKKVASSSRKDPSITGHDVRDFPLSIPTLTEQKAIAAALSDAEGWIEALERLVAKKRALKQATMQQLLTGKKRLPGFDGKWETKQLGEITDTDPENLASETSPDYTFKYISLEDINRGVLSGYTEQQFLTAPSRARRKLKNNDVLISTVRPNLLSHLLFYSEGDNWICSTGFCVIRCRKDITNPSYIFQHFFGGFISKQINTLLTGSNYPAINSGDVRLLEIPVPSFDEQTAIAKVLTDMDTEITALETKLTKARQIKQGMMQELLTGRIRLVSPAPSREEKSND